MNKKDYNSDSIKVLSDLESVRLSTGMYIGDTTNPIHLIQELLDNSLDECLNGFAKNVEINLDLDNCIYSVSDDGRGIPTDNDVPMIISTKLHSGGKFKSLKSSYKICTGLNGVGCAVVNALSKKFKIEIFKDNIYSIYEFENFNLINKKSIKTKDKISFSTKITFIPDEEIFESLIPDIDKIRQRLLISSTNLSDCNFKLIINNEEELIKLSIDDYFNQYCINDNEEISDIININILDKKDDINESLNLKLCYSFNGPITPKILGSVNLLPVESGGTHVKLLINILKDIFSPFGKKENKFLPQDILCGLRVYIDLSLINPEFGGQTKNQLINRISYLENLFSKLRKELEKYFNKNKEQLELIINRFVEYRRKIETKDIKSKSRRRTSVKYTKLKDCIEPNGELFLVEGDSAAGSLIQGRNVKEHAIMPLKGKIPNAAIKKMNILKNKEIQEIISALGTGIGSDFNIDKLRYDKIIIVSDGDEDGYHISSLEMVMFLYLLPDLTKNNKVFICKTPPYAIIKHNEFIPIWDDDQLTEARNNDNFKYVHKIKGLGELNATEAKECIFNKDKRILIPVTYPENPNKIFKLLSNSEEKRDLLNGN